MADKRSGIIKSFQYREQGSAGAYTSTDQVGEGIEVEPAANQVPLADGTFEKAGSATRLSVPIYDPSLFAALDTLQQSAAELDVIIEFWEGPDNTANYTELGFTVTPLEAGEVGQLEGIQLEMFIYGLAFEDYLTLSEAL